MADPINIDLETLLFADNSLEQGDFEVKFEIDSSSLCSDDDLVEAVEAIEQSQIPTTVSDPAMSDQCESEADEQPEQEPAASAEEDGQSVPAAASHTRFATVDEEEMDKILAGATSTHTNKMTRLGVQQFKQWLSSRGYADEFENLENRELDIRLEKFYAEVRNAEGNQYSKSTFTGLRASLNRYLRAPPHSKNICLMSNPDFHRSNQMFIAVLKKLKREGMDRTKHYPPIAEADLNKLRQSDAFSVDHPKTLQRKVWFDIALAFARRGRENLQSMKKDAFVFKKDDIGAEYVEMAYNEATKNHPGNKSDTNHESKTRMYATDGSETCPVQSLKLYLSKLHPESDLLFQQARNRVLSTDDVWYTTRPVGPRTLGDMMKVISKEANLSQIYTNHSVRATTVTLLSHAGVDIREIMRISQHRNEASVKSYNRDSSDAQKRRDSAIIQGDRSHEHTEKSLEVGLQRCPLSTISSNNAMQSSPPTHFQLTQNVQNNVLQQGFGFQPPPAPRYLFQNCTVNFNAANHPF